MNAEFWKEEAAKLEYARQCEMLKPSYLYRPRLSIDGDQWCALYGEDPQDGVAGFGESPELAYADFDAKWSETLRGK